MGNKYTLSWCSVCLCGCLKCHHPRLMGRHIMAVDVGGVSSPPPQGCTFIIINDKAMCDVSGN